MAYVIVGINSHVARAGGKNGVSKISSISIDEHSLFHDFHLGKPVKVAIIEILTTKGEVLVGGGLTIPVEDMDKLAKRWLISRGLLETNEEKENEG